MNSWVYVTKGHADLRYSKALQASLSIVVVFQQWASQKKNEVRCPFLSLSEPFSSSELVLCFVKLYKHEIDYWLIDFDFCRLQFNELLCAVWSVISSLSFVNLLWMWPHTCNICFCEKKTYVKNICAKYYGHSDLSLRTVMKWIQVQQLIDFPY